MISSRALALRIATSKRNLLMEILAFVNATTLTISIVIKMAIIAFSLTARPTRDGTLSGKDVDQEGVIEEGHRFTTNLIRASKVDTGQSGGEPSMATTIRKVSRFLTINLALPSLSKTHN